MIDSILVNLLFFSDSVAKYILGISYINIQGVYFIDDEAIPGYSPFYCKFVTIYFKICMNFVQKNDVLFDLIKTKQ